MGLISFDEGDTQWFNEN